AINFIAKYQQARDVQDAIMDVLLPCSLPLDSRVEQFCALYCAVDGASRHILNAVLSRALAAMRLLLRAIESRDTTEAEIAAHLQAVLVGVGVSVSAETPAVAAANATTTAAGAGAGASSVAPAAVGASDEPFSVT